MALVTTIGTRYCGSPRPSLAPLFAHLAEWADAHLDEVDRARATYDAAGRPLSS